MGALYFLALLGWYSMEAIEYFRQRQWRRGGARTGPRGFLPALLWSALIVWRIRFEESALLAALGGRYRSYAAGHKRLVQLVW